MPPHSFGDTMPPHSFGEGDLTANGLACQRGGRVLFQGLDFWLPAGGVLFLTGSNGIGKTSLLRIIAGLAPARAGRLRFAGGDELPPMAWLGHGEALKPLASVEETLNFWIAMEGPDRVAGQPAAAIAAFGLSGLLDLPCRYLSAGQRRRVALARIAASSSPVWLLDEPTTSLDDDGAESFAAVLAGHRRRGGRAIIATHMPIPAPDAQILDMARFVPGHAPIPAGPLVENTAAGYEAWR